MTLRERFFDNSLGHFRAEIEIMPSGNEPDQRPRPAFNGILWSFVYREDVDKLTLEKAGRNMVYPEFLDAEENPIEYGVPLLGTYPAKMHIALKDRVEHHFNRLSRGTQFYCTEGRRVAARGRVTKLTI